jgi:hypothetical protein
VGNCAEAAGSVTLQRRLHERHLAAWVPDYCRLLVRHGDHGYIQAIAHLAARTVCDDVAALAAGCPASVARNNGSAVVAATTLDIDPSRADVLASI